MPKFIKDRIVPLAILGGWSLAILAAVPLLIAKRGPAVPDFEPFKARVQSELLSHSPYWENFRWGKCEPKYRAYELTAVYRGRSAYRVDIDWAVRRCYITFGRPWADTGLLSDDLVTFVYHDDNLTETRYDGKHPVSADERLLLQSLAADVVVTFRRLAGGPYTSGSLSLMNRRKA